MNKISLLVPTRNNVNTVIDLVKDMHDYVDEIVLLDSSDKHNRRRLSAEKKRFSKLRVLYIVALGYADPFFLYGVKKCRHEWVLLLGSDERLTPSFKLDLRKIIDTNCDALAVKRYEEVYRSGKRTDFSTYQIRLFRKGRVEFKGLLHEQPKIRGRLERLDNENYYIGHITELRRGTHIEYTRMEKFSRFSYETFNSTLLDYLRKLTLPSNDDASKTIPGRLLSAWLAFYETLTLRRKEQEISNFDYFILYFLRDAMYLVKRMDIVGLLNLPGVEMKHTKQISEWKREEDSREVFEISKIIYKIGITKFLRLDDQRVVSRINKKYINEKQGPELLMLLLKRRYKGLRY